MLRDDVVAFKLKALSIDARNLDRHGHATSPGPLERPEKTLSIINQLKKQTNETKYWSLFRYITSWDAWTKLPSRRCIT